MTKRAIKKTLGKASATLTDLQTLVVEVQAILNDRPLTHVSSDIADEELLTPSHLLYGGQITSLPDPTTDDDHLHLDYSDASDLRQCFTF